MCITSTTERINSMAEISLRFDSQKGKMSIIVSVHDIDSPLNNGR